MKGCSGDGWQEDVEEAEVRLVEKEEHDRVAHGENDVHHAVQRWKAKISSLR